MGQMSPAIVLLAVKTDSVLGSGHLSRGSLLPQVNYDRYVIDKVGAWFTKAWFTEAQIIVI